MSIAAQARETYETTRILAHLWLGWAWFSTKVPSPWHWHQGVCFDLPMIFVLSLCKKCQGIVESARAVLTYARSYTQKTFFGPPSEALVIPSSIVKNTRT
jgi:hypothetical protein